MIMGVATAGDGRGAPEAVDPAQPIPFCLLQTQPTRRLKQTEQADEETPGGRRPNPSELSAPDAAARRLKQTERGIYVMTELQGWGDGAESSRSRSGRRRVEDPPQDLRELADGRPGAGRAQIAIGVVDRAGEDVQVVVERVELGRERSPTRPR